MTATKPTADVTVKPVLSPAGDLFAVLLNGDAYFVAAECDDMGLVVAFKKECPKPGADPEHTVYATAAGLVTHCDCKGFHYRGSCRHSKAVRHLTDAGLLSAAR